MLNEEITLQVMGCGDAFASGGRFNTCFYVKTKSLGFLIDCGASSLVALKKQGISTSDIDLILISHFHGDHFGGLPFFILDAGILQKREKPLNIISPPGCQEKLNAAMDVLYPGLSVPGPEIRYLEYQSYDTIHFGSLSIKAFPVLHTEQTLPHALRISLGNKILGFSGDTEWTDELYAVAENADLFICESNFYHTEAKGHMNYKTLLQKMPRLNCKKILLTHLGDEMLSRMDMISHDCAEDGKIFVL